MFILLRNRKIPVAVLKFPSITVLPSQLSLGAIPKCIVSGHLKLIIRAGQFIARSPEVTEKSGLSDPT